MMFLFKKTLYIYSWFLILQTSFTMCCPLEFLAIIAAIMSTSTRWTHKACFLKVLFQLIVFYLNLVWISGIAFFAWLSDIGHFKLYVLLQKIEKECPNISTVLFCFLDANAINSFSLKHIYFTVKHCLLGYQLPTLP